MQGYKQQRAFIIAQGPMRSTTRDFWKMVYSRKCGVVVMLSDTIELEEVKLLELILCSYHAMCYQCNNDMLYFRRCATSTGLERGHRAMESFVSSCSVKRIEVDSYSEHFQSNKQRSVCSWK